MYCILYESIKYIGNITTMKKRSNIKIAALGGCGGMGAVAIKAILEKDFYEKIIIADRDINRANEFIDSCNDKRLYTKELDVSNSDALCKLFETVDVVINTVGPYYRFGLPILKTAIKKGCHYIDLNDDWRPTLDMLSLDSYAKKADITAIIGVGASPGISNMLAVKAIKSLDQTDSLITGWGSGGKRLSYLFKANKVSGGGSYGAAIDHLLKQLTGTISVRKENEWQDIIPFKEKKITFPGRGVISAYTVGHPEPVTIPRFFPEIKDCYNVMNLPSFLTEALQWVVDQINIEKLTCHSGAALLTDIESNWKTCVLKSKGREFSWAILKKIIKSPDSFLLNTIRDLTYPGAYLPEIFAIASGQKNGKARIATARLTSSIKGPYKMENMAALTGVPLSVGLSMLVNQTNEPGVLTPEIAFDANTFFDSLAPLCSPKRKTYEDLVKIEISNI